jgi:hypothetical protein
MMKRAILFHMTALLVSGAAWGASLQNTDSQPYEMMIAEPGRPYSSPYRIIENSQVEVCFLGCEMTLLSTGQTVSVGAQDKVVIDGGVMTVRNE